MAVITAPTKIDSKTVKAKIADWISRLQELYTQMDEWAAEQPNVTVSRGEIKQSLEPLMRQFKIAPKNVPTYSVLIENQSEIRFIPNAIWTVGGNGRIDIAGNVRNHILFDDGSEQGQAPDWQLAVSDSRKFSIPFDRAAFLNLLGKRK